MSARTQVVLWLVQRASAIVLAVCVAVHLMTMIVAVQGGLSAAEIVDRVSGSSIWLSFYLTFVLAAAVHAPIGVSRILTQWTPFPALVCHGVSAALSATIAVLGGRAAIALFNATSL